MWRDPIVEEVRAIREAYSQRFNNDLKAIHRDLKAQEQASGKKLIRLPPRRIKESERTATASA